MKELMEDLNFETLKERIQTLFYYFNDGVMFSFIVFLLSVQYIWFTEENKKIKDLFFWYIIIIFLIIWNPICIYILGKFINFSSLYRVYYMLPMYPVIAYVFTKIVEKGKNIIQKILVMFVFIAFICVSGRNVFDAFPVYKVGNLYQLPDDTVFVAEIIYNDNTYKNKKAIVPYGMSSQIQQIYPSIELLYTRRVSNLLDVNGNPSPNDTDAPIGYEPIEKINEGDTIYIVELCEREKINYVVFSKSITLQDSMENHGFEIIASGEGVDIYRKIPNND